MKWELLAYYYTIAAGLISLSPLPESPGAMPDEGLQLYRKEGPAKTDVSQAGTVRLDTGSHFSRQHLTWFQKITAICYPTLFEFLSKEARNPDFSFKSHVADEI